MKHDRTKTLGERIRELREACDLSLREFGKRLERIKPEGLSAAFLSDVELGRRHPSDKVLMEMARVLNATVDDLKSYDVRPTVKEIGKLIDRDPAYGFAFRMFLDKKMSPDEILKAIETAKKTK